MRDPKILAYTVSYGDRSFLEDTIPDMRGTAGVWFDWFVCLGAPSDNLKDIGEKALNHPKQRGIQYLQVWPENRGQHHATARALALAKTEGYEWLLRLDDDLKPKTKRWLKKMVANTLTLHKVTQDTKLRIISVPKILGLNNPLMPVGIIEKPGLGFKAEVMDILGGACRLHPMSFMQNFEPDLYAPVGRRDPQSIGQHVVDNQGVMVRYPEIRMVHRTDELEAQDSDEQKEMRMMGHYWPYLGATNENNS